MSRDPRLVLTDILESIELIRAYTKSLDLDEFKEDSRTQDAVLRRFEVIGEAVKSLPSDLKDRRPSVRWGDIAGLRDVLIHGYHRVRLSRVWAVIEDGLNGLEEAAGDLLAEVEEDGR